MKKNLQTCMAIAALGAPVFSVNAGNTFEQYGDMAQVGIPIAAGMVAFAHGDFDGLGRLAEGALYTAAATHTLKFTVNAKRPNGGDYSWPSGHTSAAVQGAAFLQFEYGPSYGIPAYVAAGLVGYSRVNSNHHYWRDVVAGAVLATGVQYMVSKKGYSFTVTPMFDGESTGLFASMKF